MGNESSAPEASVRASSPALGGGGHEPEDSSERREAGAPVDREGRKKEKWETEEEGVEGKLPGETGKGEENARSFPVKSVATRRVLSARLLTPNTRSDSPRTRRLIELEQGSGRSRGEDSAVERRRRRRRK
ncbi:hypothetical protein EYF80_036517 [Liparis tanakae]|uniref:Uncharacterized protein n=1 Tax=Liparis tanakae TaxID=230148 RepID=A0A4Z2GKA4_9TELE|nr:hypothetical protein EYF80_036517 [Liparis tanakae]